jgi:primosomal protein N' (replication factor Y)
LKKYAEVLVDVANRRLDQSYHYLIPDNLDLEIGMLVLVPLRNRKVKGLVVGIDNEPPDLEKDLDFREIEAILEEKSLIPMDLIELASFLAQTTICPVAQALQAVWPFLKGKVETWYLPLATMEEDDVKVLKLLDPEAYQVLLVLNRARKKAVEEKVLLKRAGVGRGLLDEMVKQNWIKKEQRFTGPARLKKESLFSEEMKSQNTKQEILNIELSPAQEKALAQIWNLYKKGQDCILLHGLTGSGKTEVYRELVARILDEGGEAIVLVPEISLTSQLAKAFRLQFRDLVAVVHSGISPAEKIAVWEQILKGQKKVVIGARSAVFAPLPNLKLIILDEEHDAAYKQDENPKYHTRDVARQRMKQKRGLVLLGSATPSLEAYAAAQREKIGLVYLGERYNQRALPRVEIVDMKRELAQGNKSMFSLLLQAKIRDRIHKGEQCILFLNRRGYSTFVFCRECGFVANCPSCDVSLTYHSFKQELWCHYCDFKQKVFHRCPECGSRYIRFFGQGTQKVEEEVSNLFPGVKTLRLDTDTSARQRKQGEIIEQFGRQKAPILIGTQMLAKGLDFPNVTLVGMISADQLLNRPDFRSRERAFQLLTQVAGRAGRGLKEGEVIIQTYSPADRAIVRSSEQDYTAFFWEEIAYRKRLNYPPFAHLIRVLLFHRDEEKVISAAQDLAGCLRLVLKTGDQKAGEFQILGPAPAVLTKLKNEFRWQVAVKGKWPDELRKIVHAGVKLFYKGVSGAGIKMSIEVNPLN